MDQESAVLLYEKLINLDKSGNVVLMPMLVRRANPLHRSFKKYNFIKWLNLNIEFFEQDKCFSEATLIKDFLINNNA